MLPEFDLLIPRTLPEALDMLAAGAPEVKPLAGGTNVIVDLRDGRHRYKALMDISKLGELQGIQKDNGHIVMGGGTTIAELLTDPLVAEYGLPLREAAAVLGSPLVRNRATVAGNLVDASPAADTAPPLLVLDAEVELKSREGTRRVPLEDFIIGPNATLLGAHELLVSIRWPIASSRSFAAHRKIALRKAVACSVVTAAVMLESDEEGRCQRARIGLGAVAPTPVRPHAAEQVLRGQRLTPEVINEAAHRSAEAAHPIDDVRGSAAYRQRMVEVVVRRLLMQAAVQTVR